MLKYFIILQHKGEIINNNKRNVEVCVFVSGMNNNWTIVLLCFASVSPYKFIFSCGNMNSCKIKMEKQLQHLL